MIGTWVWCGFGLYEVNGLGFLHSAMILVGCRILFILMWDVLNCIDNVYFDLVFWSDFYYQCTHPMRHIVSINFN